MGDRQVLAARLCSGRAAVYVYVPYNRGGAVHDCLANIVFSSLFIFVVRASLGLLPRPLHLAALAHAGRGWLWVVATSGGLKLSMNKGDFYALLAAVMMAIFVVRLERLAREVPATQLAHMLGISLFGWSLLEVARSGIGRGFGFLRAILLPLSGRRVGPNGADVYSANAILSLGQLALLVSY